MLLHHKLEASGDGVCLWIGKRNLEKFPGSTLFLLLLQFAEKTLVSLTQAASTAVINKSGTNSATGTAPWRYIAPASNAYAF